MATVKNQTGGTGLNTYMASLVDMDQRIYADNMEMGVLEALLSQLKQTDQQTEIITYQTKLSAAQKKDLADKAFAAAKYQIASRERKLTPEQLAVIDGNSPTGQSFLDIATERAIGTDKAGIEQKFEIGPVTAGRIYNFSQELGQQYEQGTVISYIRNSIGRNAEELRANITNLNDAESLRKNAELAEQIKNKGAEELTRVLAQMIFEYRAKRDRTQ